MFDQKIFDAKNVEIKLLKHIENCMKNVRIN